jgi:ribonuclease R
MAGRRGGLRQAKVVERIGRMDDPRTFSLIAIHAHGLPHVFPPAAIELAEAAEECTLAGRDDLRDIPLVTIDGEDARDFDDAVWAEADTDPANPGGWHILVAIADVAWYVRPGDALDRSARERGNSVYFPDRVVPMLPEALSNGLCSLRPKENRACMAVHIWLDSDGRKRKHRFVRGLMRSAARLTYRQVQDAIDGNPDDTTGPLLESVIRPLFGAYAALDIARNKRGTLDLDIAEKKVVIADSGDIDAVLPRERLAAHKLIEEYMIAANVAAAETLATSGIGCLYRIHAQPDSQKIEALRTFLTELQVGMPPGPLTQPRHFTRLLQHVADTPFALMINELVLRAQAQAVYSPENIGHFGLALKHYAHFTSPIRRYSDLLVHRALIAALKLGEGELPAGGDGTFGEAGEHLSMTERRAATAERETVDRFAAAYLATSLGKTFEGRIGGVSKFGLYVRLERVGVDGFVPVSTLGADFFDHDAARHMLVGRRTGQAYRLGENVEVRLAAADPITGSVVLHLLESPQRRERTPRRPPRNRFERRRR